MLFNFNLHQLNQTFFVWRWDIYATLGTREIPKPFNGKAKLCTIRESCNSSALHIPSSHRFGNRNKQGRHEGICSDLKIFGVSFPSIQTPSVPLSTSPASLLPAGRGEDWNHRISSEWQI